MELIDKAALAANIEARYNECLKRAKIIDAEYWNGKADAYRDMLIVLDTHVSKEVDLEKEKDDYWNKLCDDEFGEFLERDAKWFDDIAKHFFELGVNTAQKGE